MRATATLGLAALAQSVSAVMIPSTVSAPEFSNIEAANLKTFGLDPKSQLIKVDCAGCAYGQKGFDGRTEWQQGIENALVLNLSVGAELGTLELNGVQFYPPLMNFAEENPVPYIAQVPTEMTLVEIKKQMQELAKNALRLTSWSFQSGPVATVSESGDELLTIHLQLDALEREHINVPDIGITALKTAEGEMSIIKIVMADKEQVAKEECKTWPMMCKLKDMLNGFKGMKKPHLPSFGSLGKPADCEDNKKVVGAGTTASGTQVDQNGDWIPGSGPPPWITGDADYKGWKPGQGRPPPWVKHGWKGHHGGPPGEHHGHGDHDNSGWKPGQGPPPWVKNGWKHGHGHGYGGMRHGGFHRAMHVFGRVMLTVFIPILLGIAAGMVTYLLGMIVGAIVVAIYMKIRGRKTKYQAVSLEDEAEEEDYDHTPRESFDEKDSPPIYAEKE